MKLYPLKSWQEMEREMFERSRCTLRIPFVLIGAVILLGTIFLACWYAANNYDFPDRNLSPRQVMDMGGTETLEKP